MFLAFQRQLILGILWRWHCIPSVFLGSSPESTRKSKERTTSSPLAFWISLALRTSRWGICWVLRGENVTDRLSVIGMLSCFYFPLQVNRFEQFNINYANEKLQEYFNKHIFSLEQLEYNRWVLSMTLVNTETDIYQQKKLYFLDFNYGCTNMECSADTHKSYMPKKYKSC